MTRNVDRPGRELSVGEVAASFEVTVRTLHHYDAIGLLRPAGRSLAGYRLYGEADLQRLQQIVVYRRLGFALDQIAELLAADPNATTAHLRRQRDRVTDRIAELRALADALDLALMKESNGMSLTPQEQRDLFGDGFDDAYAEEAEARWGDSPAWAQSKARTAAYTKADWQQVKEEMDAVNAAFVAAMRAELPANDPAAMDAAEAHRRHINDRFYDITPEFHRNLAEMYVTDPRFTATYEAIEPGLARYVRDAINANADRLAAGSS